MEPILPALALLACPLMMGACMWMMSRSRSGSRVEPVSEEAAPSIAALRAEQRRLAAEIERLEMTKAGQGESPPEGDEQLTGAGAVGRS